MTRVLTLIVVLAGALEAPAQTVYRWVMPDGSIRYSDQPAEPGAVEGGPVSVAPAQTYGAPSILQAPPPEPPTPGLQPASPQPEPLAAAFPGYETFDIVAPQEGAVRVNSGDLPVRVRLEPALADGHVIEIRVDGSVVSRGRATEFVLNDVDRGLHSIGAAVLDGSGAEVAVASAVPITLIRTSLCDRRRKDFAGCAPKGPCNCQLRAVPF